MKHKYKKGDNFKAIFNRFSGWGEAEISSKTLGGKEMAGKPAFDGQIFQIKKVKRAGVETTNGHFFLNHLFSIEVVK